MFGDPSQFRNPRKMMRYDRRGSSAKWKDDHEFLTPMTCNQKKQFNPNDSINHEALGPNVSNFSPFMKS